MKPLTQLFVFPESLMLDGGPGSFLLPDVNYHIFATTITVFF